MKIDRVLQLDLLNRLAEAYPQTVQVGSWITENPEINGVLYYLSEHDLIDGTAITPVSEPQRFVSARITASGIDFLADDGGLSAILGVVTVKLHEDTIRQLLIDRVEASSASPEDRSSLVKAIRSLPGKALETLTEKLIEKGAEQMLDGTPKLGTLLVQLVAQQFG